MPPRASAQTAEEVTPEVTPEVNPEVTPEVIAEVAPEVFAEIPHEIVSELVNVEPLPEASNPFFVQHREEAPVFLEKWASSQRGISAEVLGTFVFIARQQNWIVDTPSGWQKKLSSWIDNN